MVTNITFVDEVTQRQIAEREGLEDPSPTTKTKKMWDKKYGVSSKGCTEEMVREEELEKEKTKGKGGQDFEKRNVAD